MRSPREIGSDKDTKVLIGENVLEIGWTRDVEGRRRGSKPSRFSSYYHVFCFIGIYGKVEGR